MSLAVSGWSLTHNRQLEGLGGLVDEWFLVGLNYHVHGALGIEAGHSDVALSPGYPAFVAAVVSGTGHPAVVTPYYFRRCMELVFLAQAVLLAASAAALFLWLSPTCGHGVALAAATVLGTGPYTVILTGLLHYDIPHIFMLVVGCWTLQGAIEHRHERTYPLLLAGLFWGVATLIRPVTLPLPFFLAVALYLLERPALRPMFKTWLPFALGMALAVVPYVARNHALTGRWIFSAESWMGLWGSTVKDLGFHPNHYVWERLLGDFMPTFTRVTGEPVYSRHAFLAHVVPLEDAFREVAFDNIRRQPLVYARNCLHSFVALNFAMNSVLVSVFQYLQTTREWPSQDWFALGHPREFLPWGAREAFSWFVGLLTLLSVTGGALAIRRWDASLAAATAVFASICAIHTLVYMDFNYFYVKVPFLLVFSASALSRLGGRRAPVAAAAVAGVSLLLSWVVLF